MLYLQYAYILQLNRLHCLSKVHMWAIANHTCLCYSHVLSYKLHNMYILCIDYYTWIYIYSTCILLCLACSRCRHNYEINKLLTKYITAWNMYVQTYSVSRGHCNNMTLYIQVRYKCYHTWLHFFVDGLCTMLGGSSLHFMQWGLTVAIWNAIHSREWHAANIHDSWNCILHGYHRSSQRPWGFWERGLAPGGGSHAGPKRNFS